MGVLDFKEIPQANIADGNQDCFELFAREFLNSIGFSIVENPDRGQDGGRDLIVLEKRNGIIGDSEVRWLVSCKHKAHSGNAVLQSDEEDLYDRVQTHKCNGFMGIYSTVPSSSLHNKFEALKEKCEVKIFDHEEIERVLLNNKSANKLIQRFFPDYYNKSKLPANILSEYSPLRCRKCGKDLLQRDILDKYTGIVVFVQDMDYYYDNNYSKKFTDIYCCCKGECDQRLEAIERDYDFITGWEDISDLAMPTRFLSFIISIINRLYSHEDHYTEEAFENLKDIIISIAQIAMRQQTENEVGRLRDLSTLPKDI